MPIDVYFGGIEMKWFILAPLNMICAVLCYLTNPLIVLLADENGELHGVFRYWQTWDDSLDSAYFMHNVIPQMFPILDYSYDSHYAHHVDATHELAALGRTRNYSTLIKPLTTTERLKRYACRVLWLYRNNAYGFAFYLFGRDVDGGDMIMKSTGDVVRGYSREGSMWNKAWIYKNTAKIFWRVHWEIFLGWKIDYHEAGVKRAMLANRIAIRFK